MLDFLRDVRHAFTNRYRNSAAESWCGKYFLTARAAPASKSSALVVIEGVEDPFFYCIQGLIIASLRTMAEIRVGRWVSRSLGLGSSRSLRGFVGAQLDCLIFSRLRWGRLYDVFCDGPVGRADFLRAPWRELSWAWEAWRLFRSLQSKDHLASLRVRDILIGDLVIDTYLRFKPAPELDLRDRYLFVVLRRALKDIDTSRAFFRKTKPALYLTTYASYVQHGVPARVAVALGIPSWAFANGQEFRTRLTLDHLLHTQRSANYSKDFAVLPDQEAKLGYAAEVLGKRVAGFADTATANQRSAYETRTADVPRVQNAAVIFLHDFFDSAHIYRWMIFHDFWEWASFTIETLQEAGLPFFVKPHPNQQPESGAALERLRAKYPGVNFISADVSNRQLVDAEMGCAVTVYGSVAAEMAYMGIPSISCGDNPHASFDAFHLADSKEGYRAMLRDFRNLSRDRERMRRQACAFYFMHNLNIVPDLLQVREKLFPIYMFFVDLESKNLPFDGHRLGHLLNDVRDTSAFRNFVAEIAGPSFSQSPDQA